MRKLLLLQQAHTSTALTQNCMLYFQNMLHVLIDINTAPRLIMQYAGCIDVAREAGNESIADHGMNSLLYSSRLHKTFQTAYENGQRESRERLGYGDGAVVVYNPGRPKPGM